MPLLVAFADPESARMLLESGPVGLEALVDRIGAHPPYPQVHRALEVLVQMADRRWMWHSLVEAGDWVRVRSVASRYVAESPLHLAAPLRAQAIIAAVALALQLGDEPLRTQVQQMLADPQALVERLEGDRELADRTIQRATGLLNN